MNLTTNKLPPAIAAAIASIKWIGQAPQRSPKLHPNMMYARLKLKEENIKALPAEAAIIPIWVGTQWKALEMKKYCFQQGIYLQAVHFPLVPKNKAILKLAINADHTKAQIDRMVEVLKAAQWEVN